MSIRLHMITLILLTIVAMFLGVLLGIGFMLAAGVFLGMLGWGESVPTEVLLLLIPLTVVAVEWAVVAALKRVPARCEVIVCGGNAYCIGINPIAYVCADCGDLHNTEFRIRWGRHGQGAEND
jgi:hypothetical protein